MQDGRARRLADSQSLQSALSQLLYLLTLDVVDIATSWAERAAIAGKANSAPSPR